MQVSEAEQAAMRRALELGEAVRGRTSPNPAVGAVVLDPSGDVAGEGATQPPGGPHAEVEALREAGQQARGGTMVVTLEPCAHTGRTPPCVDALIEAGIARLVYAVDDPNPEAAGGADRLREAGVEVVPGVSDSDAAAGALRPWLHALRTGRPFVISSAAARADSHAFRATVDAIVVGSGTVLADDPHLTVRDADDRLAGRQPLRVVLDRRHRVRQSARVLDNAAETLLLDTAVPRFALKALHDLGTRHVLLEGGPTLAGAFIEARCVDEVIAYIAPKLLGTGQSALGDAGIGTIADALTLEVDTVSRIGGDVKIVARPVWSEGV